MSEFPIEKIRAETPGLSDAIFLNSAGASLRPKQVTETVKHYLDYEDIVGGHEAAYQTTRQQSDAYQSIAKLLGADSKEITLTTSNTQGWQRFVASLQLERGDEVIVSRAEFISGLTAIIELKRSRGVVVKIVDYDMQGVIDLSQLQQLLNPRTRLVCLTHIATSNGAVHPVAEAGRIIHENSDAFYLLDAAQSVGQLDIDVKKIGCHALSATGRKFLRAPRGTGFLYIEKNCLNTLRPDLPDGHYSALNSANEVMLVEGGKRFELFEKSIANVLGLKDAVDYANSLGPKNIQNRVDYLADYFSEKLRNIEAIKVSEGEKHGSGIITISPLTGSTQILAEHISQHNIRFKLVSKNDGALDLSARNLNDVIRFSLHYFNTEEELSRVSEVIGLYGSA